MKKGFIKYLALLFAVGISLPSPLISEESKDLTALKEEALSIVKRLGGTLKPKLIEAIQSEGPARAIDICSTQAPEIAKSLSLETGWRIKRVSLKPRNSESAVADAWETKTLRQFEEQLSNLTPPANLIRAEVVDSQFRFLKAQPVEALCLNCHGETLSPDVREALERHYPNDQATGYSMGQIRGAFSLSKDL